MLELPPSSFNNQIFSKFGSSFRHGYRGLCFLKPMRLGLPTVPWLVSRRGYAAYGGAFNLDERIRGGFETVGVVQDIYQEGG